MSGTPAGYSNQQEAECAPVIVGLADGGKRVQPDGHPLTPSLLSYAPPPRPRHSSLLPDSTREFAFSHPLVTVASLGACMGAIFASTAIITHTLLRRAGVAHRTHQEWERAVRRLQGSIDARLQLLEASRRDDHTEVKELLARPASSLKPLIDQAGGHENPSAAKTLSDAGSSPYDRTIISEHSLESLRRTLEQIVSSHSLSTSAQIHEHIERSVAGSNRLEKLVAAL
ncbi:hypothetical protein TREMEDRAFT_55892, partial [Tremella mesenterica DSM 1558]|uniref:uncharacterized protein n=1 Tax=Tremella mesenterica (strain ATCC 24925 / CBS 8224 / DSM 1558 / NBRC 9311 / NRRL Y-6157 / RJB 2259-6 / UBC 559-6) TaxID=578456 RepID=UPI0003F498BE